MKVVLIGHSYIISTFRAKLAAVAAIGGIELVAVVPSRWRYVFGDLAFSPGPHCGEYRVLAVPATGHGNHRCIWYEGLTDIIARESPDVVHVEEEPWSWAAWQCMWSSHWCKPRPALTFFTWDNILARQPLLHEVTLRMVLRSADGAIAGNREAKERLRARGFRQPVVVVPQLGVDPLPPLAHAPAPTDRGLVVGYVGRLVEAKGIDLLLSALTRIASSCQLRIIGAGTHEAALRTRTDELGLQHRVDFQPAVPHQDVQSQIAALDALVLPSVSTPGWREQFGHVLIEAMACGVPVVGSSSGAIPEVIGDAGLVFSEGNVEELAAKLEALLRSRDLRHELGQRGRERVLAHYTHEVVARQTVAVWRSALDHVR